MTRYEFINPSDDYEFEAADDEVAEAAVTVVSGMAGWRTIDEEEERSGGLADLADDPEQYVQGIKRTIDERRPEVVAALRSLEIKPAQRIRLGVDPDVWHDEMRTSISDYRAAALEIANAMERAS